MRSVSILLIAALLSGCLDPGASEPVEEPGEDVQRPPPARPAPPNATAPLPDLPATVDPMFDLRVDTLEGIDCTFYQFSVNGPNEPIKNRAPDNFGFGSSGLAVYTVTAYHCRALVLNDQVLSEDSWVAYGSTATTPPEDAPGDPSADFIVEAFTSWPLLEEAWLRDGVNVFNTTFSFEKGGTTGPILELNFEEFSYNSQVIQSYNRYGVGNPEERRYFAGNGTVAYDVMRTETSAPTLTQISSVSAEGGVVGEMLPFGTAGTYTNGTASLKILNIGTW